MNNAIIERIRYILKREYVTQVELAKRSRIPISTINSVLSRGSNPSGIFLAKLIETFPDYSANWILTGVGDPRLPPETRSEAVKMYSDLVRIDKKDKYNIVALVKVNEKCFSAFSLVELKELTLKMENMLDLIKSNNM